jgi:hypothetical protein
MLPLRANPVIIATVFFIVTSIPEARFGVEHLYGGILQRSCQRPAA